MMDANLRDGFAKRFEADGESYLFRASLGASGIRVTAAERETFVRQYRNRVRLLTWGGVVVTVAVVLLIAWLTVSAGRQLPDVALYLLLCAMSGLIMAGTMWLWYAPNRALAGRLASAPGRSREEARRLAFRRMPWSSFGVAVAFIGVAAFRLYAQHVDVLHGWSRLWLVALAALAVLLAVQAVRKWRIERDG